MSLKENIQYVKEELNSEEKFFESAVKAESFIKKYKKLLIAGLAGVVLLLGAKASYDVMQENKKAEINTVFNKLQKSPSPQLNQELNALQPQLFEAWELSQAVVNANIEKLSSLKNSKQTLVSDIASYQEASLKKDHSLLDSYALRQDAIYKDEAVVQSAILLLEKKDFDEAHKKLSTISKESPLAPVATLLLHYGVK